ncbi:DUF1127 domain-containing protein [Ruegeria sp. Alg231-54]|uniref:DUF1127 domain-containing protein n=1 Tax=Ruegeria sp. Alg231-54 TaxID=1922221 RepID=UPI000D54EE6A|nr:DUF1127 domain-containing protein [Ruegeria sp. Alg231-54]
MTQIAIKQHCKPQRRSLLSSLLDSLSLLRQRQTLARLDDRALEDIGITRKQAEVEASRSIWDAPDFWQK